MSERERERETERERNRGGEIGKERQYFFRVDFWMKFVMLFLKLNKENGIIKY